jgi:hypothetical protein
VLGNCFVNTDYRIYYQHVLDIIYFFSAWSDDYKAVMFFYFSFTIIQMI